MNSKQYLEKEAFEKDNEKLADLAKMMGVESMGEEEGIVNE
jgi:hypothetical protein